MNFIQALRMALARVANWVDSKIIRTASAIKRELKNWCQTEINSSKQSVLNDLSANYIRNDSLDYKCQSLGYRTAAQIEQMINDYVDSGSFTVTIQYTYNWTPVYISKTLPQSADDYDVILPKTQDWDDLTEQPIKTVTLENVKRLYFWDEANGLCVSDSNGNSIIYNHYTNYSGFNSSVWDEDTNSNIPALDKNNFVVTEDMTVTVSHIYA